jgi:hypothetical protein
MFLVDVLRRRYLASKVSRQLARARRSGVGVYVNEWLVSADDLARSGSETCVEQVLEWCRHTMGQSRRPWGIDHFDLALAVSHPAEHGVRSLRLRRMRPTDLYSEDGLASRIAEFLPWVRHEGNSGQPVRDAAHVALPA